MVLDRRTALKQIGGAGTVVALTGCVGVQQQGSGEGSDNGGQSGDNGTQNGNQSNTEAKKSGPSGSATAWYSLPEPEIPARKKAIKAFNKQSNHQIEGADISDMAKKTTSAIPAGQGPQTFEWAHDWVGDYFQRGFIVDQSDELSISLDTFTSVAREAIQFEGNVVGLPHTAETVALIYNTDVVDTAPKTVADMVSVMKRHHDPGNNQYGLSYPFDPYFTSAWTQAFGGHYFDANEDPVLGIDSEECIKGLEFALDNFKPYMPSDPTYDPQAAAFAEGNAAFAINGPWYLATLNEKDVNYKTATLPTPKGGKINPYTTITLWYFSKAMAENNADTKAARAFIEWYVTNEDHILELAKEQGSIPVLANLVGSDKLPTEVQAFSKMVEQGTPLPTRPRVSKVWPAMQDALTKAFNGDASAKAALDEAAKTIRSNWK